MIVFDASALVSAALKADSVPEQALLRAEEVDVFALSPAVESEIVAVLSRPKFARVILELALAAGAEIIVSGDEDLLVLHPWRGVRILQPTDYLARS